MNLESLPKKEHPAYAAFKKAAENAYTSDLLQAWYWFQAGYDAVGRKNQITLQDVIACQYCQGTGSVDSGRNGWFSNARDEVCSRCSGKGVTHK